MATAKTAKKPAKKLEEYLGTGRRKNSTARVRLRPGKGEVRINHKTAEEYFGRERDRIMLNGPLVITETTGKFDMVITVRGGGNTGQAGAIRMGVARALVNFDESLQPTLRKNGDLTRDSRMVESKKTGFRKARRKEQYSKR